MGKADRYRQVLPGLEDWESFLLRESGLPGPRANLELAQAVADMGSREQFLRWLANGPDQAPANTPAVFLAVCGVIGLGRLLREGDGTALSLLRSYAGDPRWRIREAVAMALQRLGEGSMDDLLRAVEPWIEGSPLEQRAVAAALCEPKLLQDEAHAARTLGILDDITRRLSGARDRKGDDFKTLRQGLGYAWSVAVAACPARGRALFERWARSDDPDVRWVVRENLKKDRLRRMDAAWVAVMARRMGGA